MIRNTNSGSADQIVIIKSHNGSVILTDDNSSIVGAINNLKRDYEQETNAIDTNIDELIKTDVNPLARKLPDESIDLFFRQYDAAKDAITPFGPYESHEYLIRSSVEYLQPNPYVEFELYNIIEYQLQQSLERIDELNDIILHGGGVTTGTSGSGELTTFEERAHRAIELVATAPGSELAGSKLSYWFAQAKFAYGDMEGGHFMLNKSIQDTSGAMFRVWAEADTYGRWNHIMTDEQKSNIKEELVRYRYYSGGSTANHHLMYATARFLAGQFFPDQPLAKFRDNDPSGREFLYRSAIEFSKYGLTEYDSPNYSAIYYGVMRSLADLSSDIELRDAARTCLNLMILTDCCEFLDGHWLSASLRDHNPYRGQFDMDGGAYVLWLYSGGSAEPLFDTHGVAFLISHAIGDYVPPALADMERIGRERTAIPYASFDTDTWGSRKYAQSVYANKTYGLYSVYENYPVHTGFHAQYHRWSVRWLSPTPKSTFFVKHPAHVDTVEGATGFEIVLQYEGTLIGLYDIPAAHPVQYVLGMCPTDMTAYIDDSDNGAIYLNYGSVLIAYRASVPFSWNNSEEEFRINHTRFGFVVDTANPTRYSGNAAQQLSQFKNDVAQHRFITDSSSIKYDTLSGTQLELKSDGMRKINGQLLNITDWKRIDNPWMRQELGSSEYQIK